MAAKKTKEKLTLEENFEKLDELIEKLEDEDITLEDSFKAYSEGMNILKTCTEEIDRVEKEVMKLSADGSLEPLDEE
ncbi:MAG: exodeoxyribonuclease VII small subunit [Lachnospiraceae bacterium]|nr:exodeoxyribonuclease VII small subunit [Lachnospiraceae bacterium]